MDGKDLNPKPAEENTGPESTTRGKIFASARRVFTKAKALGAELVPQEEKIPLEDINMQTVAKAIYELVTHPAQERMGKLPTDLVFDRPTVITHLGYILPWGDSDYKAKLPEVYERVRGSLFDIQRLGALDIRFDEEPNSHGENTFFAVSDVDLLKKIVDSSQQDPIQNGSSK